MDGLLPIIRRVRRPLVPVAGAAGGVDAEPAAVPVKAKPEPVTGSQEQQRKEKDGKVASDEPAK